MAPKKTAKPSTRRRLTSVRDTRREPRQEDYTLDLDSIEKERSAGTFSIKLGGKVIDFLDASDVDWKDLLDLGSVGDPEMWLRAITTDADYKWLSEQEFPGWKFEKVLQEYQAHFGVDNPGNDDGSRSSSTGIAGR